MVNSFKRCDNAIFYFFDICGTNQVLKATLEKNVYLHTVKKILRDICFHRLSKTIPTHPKKRYHSQFWDSYVKFVFIIPVIVKI